MHYCFHIHIYITPSLFFKKKILLYLLPCLTIFWIVFRIVVLAAKINLFGIDLSTEALYLSWYANGLLFVSLGMLLKKLENNLIKIKTSIVLIGLLLSFAIMVTEYFLLNKLLGEGISYTFGSIFCVISIITFSVKYPTMFSNNIFMKIKGNWTMFVYILHMALITFVDLLFSQLNISGIIFDWLRPVIVLFIALIFALIFNFILNKIKNFLRMKAN